MNRLKHATDMTNGSIWRLILNFALPTAFGLLFQQLYNTVDTIVVGQFVGTRALAAVGGTTAIINTLVGIGSGLATGSSVIISQRYGAKDDKGLSTAVHTTITFTFIIGAVLSVIGVLAVSVLLRMMSMPEDTFPLAKTYLTIYFAGLSGLFIYNMGSGILQAVGDSRRPLLFLIFSALLNTVLDLLFVVVFKLGVAGVAYATIIAQFCSAILVLTVLTRDTGAYGIRWNKLTLNTAMLKSIWRLGYPTALTGGIVAFSNVFVQSYVAYFGSACLAGWSSYAKIDAFIMIPVNAISTACTAFVGQNFGANKLRRVRKGIFTALGMASSITLVLCVLVMVLSKSCIRLFTPDEDVVYYGSFFINTISIFYVFIAVYQNLAAALRGIGEAKSPMIAMLSCFVAFRQCYLFVVKNFLGNSLRLLALGYPIGWVLVSCWLLLRLRKTAVGQRSLSKSES